MSLAQLHAMNGKHCRCGKPHRFSAEIIVGSGVIRQIPAVIEKFHVKKVFVLSDNNTWAAAAEQVCQLLDSHCIPYSSYCFSFETLEPDEVSVGSAVMHLDFSCDMILAVGSGVINDIGKILSALTRRPYIIVGTAPSMDGYASATSSMTRDGLKISLPSRGADVIIGDTDILCQAPEKLLLAGLGDMIAKYVSICEWRISALITGEYYCEEVASLIRSALKQCVDQADGLIRRDPAAVQTVFEGLVIGGVAMNYAGLSRPASGVEHYISHVLDMRGVAFGTPVDLHGIQCAVGTLLAIRIYEKLKRLIPDEEKALQHAQSFDIDVWNQQLRSFLGRGADSMIALEAKDGKYDPNRHRRRLSRILKNWDAILEILEEELPSVEILETLFDQLRIPKCLSALGTPDSEFPMIFRCTKDIRDKYVLSRLLWDLGILEELMKSEVSL